MREKFTKIISLLLITTLSTNLYGCVNSKTTATSKIPGFLVFIYETNSTNEELYDQIAWHRNNQASPSGIKRSPEDMELYGHMSPALVWQIKNNINNIDKKYHVILDYFEPDGETWQDGIIPADYIDEINQECDTDFNLDEWIDLTGSYYYTFTADELMILSSYENFASFYYVGSGEGNIKDMDFNTEEGITIYTELYGDGYVQYTQNSKTYMN